MLIVPPLMQLLVFGYAATFDLNHVPYRGLRRRPQRRIARPGCAAFRGSPMFQAGGDVVTRRSEIAPLIDGRQVLLVLHIGPQLQPRPARPASRARCRSSSTAATPTPR